MIEGRATLATRVVALLCAVALMVSGLPPSAASAESVFAPQRSFVMADDWVSFQFDAVRGTQYEIVLRPFDYDADLYLFRGGERLGMSLSAGVAVDRVVWRADASGPVTAWVHGLGAAGGTSFELVASAVDGGPARRVGLQVGHWRNWEASAPLNRNSGSSGGGMTEAEVNLAIARLTAESLRAMGYVVDILPTVIPRGYKADAVVAIHADGASSGSRRGFFTDKPARAPVGSPEDALRKAIDQEYAAATGLSYVYRSTVNTRYYYGYSAVAAKSPMVIIETGFLTSPADREVIVKRPELSARGIANGVDRFLRGR
jgi:hypothetical protein